MINKRGQVTIFVIIAVVIIGATISYFAFRDSFKIGGIPASIEPVYTSFLSCLEEDLSVGIDVIESQAGYIIPPDFEAGSPYMPFSNQLDFLGNPVPYWYYVSGNNLEREQVPSISSMEEQLGGFIEDKIDICRFDSYYDEGFIITQEIPEAKVSIQNNEVLVNLNMDLTIEKANDTALIRNHKVVVKSKLGKLYNSARKIYEKEQTTLFLENYAVDTLRLYAPVDGVELSCSPKTWIADNVFDELQDAIVANTLALKSKGGSYSLRNEDNKYFVVDLGVSEDVRFLNSKSWPNSFEVVPTKESVMIASPVGNQPGLGILGFCYAPYHFVYNVKYPVLIQVQDGEEIFQFPVAVVVQGNKPREALDVSAVEVGEPELCRFKNTLVEVNAYDTQLNPIVADISYECLGTKCDIGKTNSEDLEFPQCVNGYILAKSEGFVDSEYLYSTIEEGSVDIILDKLYEREINLKLDGREYGGNAIISFISDKSSKTIVYPDQKKVELSEGQYEVQVYIYKNSTLRLESTTSEQCMDVPKPGIIGIFGLTEEKCFDIEIPAQIVSSALSGGGKENYYILESELVDSNIVEINTRGLPIPKSVEELQNNYILFEEKDLDIMFI